MREAGGGGRGCGGVAGEGGEPNSQQNITPFSNRRENILVKEDLYLVRHQRLKTKSNVLFLQTQGR